MGANTHPTAEPVQTATETMAVFADGGLGNESDLHLVKRVEVPEYSLPTTDGVALGRPSGSRSTASVSDLSRLGRDKQLSMAVTFAVTAPDSAPEPELVEGEEFMVLDELDAPMKFVEFERNPAIAGCWNPNQESPAEYADIEDKS